ATADDRRWPAESLAPVRLLADELGLPGVAVSPDGDWLVVAAAQGDPRDGGRRSLWRRRVDGSVTGPLPGADGASQPFWSSGGRAIAFFADGNLKRIDLNSGATQVLAEAPFPHGGAWGPRGVIVFAPRARGGLVQVAAGGGPVTPASSLDAARGESWHR